MEKTYIDKLNKIEQDNLNYLLSKEKSKNRLIKKIKTFISNPINSIVIHNKMKKIPQLNNNKNDFQIKNDEMLKRNIPRIAIYTCITGNYDEICEPQLSSNNIDYFLFTDNNIKSEIWNVKAIDKILKKKYNNIEINRYYKFHPFEFIDNKKYDYAIYIDGNICIMSDLTPLTYAINEKTGLALHHHCKRDDLYDESKVCCILGKGDKNKIKNQIDKYQNEKFPKNFGLFECNVIVSNLNNDKAKKIFNDWWNEFYRAKSYRDQLSFPYILWKNGYIKEDVGVLGKNVYLNPKFLVKKHI